MACCMRIILSVSTDAGIMALPNFTPNNAGIELQWATNHLGHFALTQLLLPKLLLAKGRVVNVASVAHKQAPKPLSLAHLPPPSAKYSAWTAYGISKLSNMMHAAELQT